MVIFVKRLFFNFLFLDVFFNKVFYKEGNLDIEIVYMGCCICVMLNIYDFNKEIVIGCGNLSFILINLFRLVLIFKLEV